MQKLIRVRVKVPTDKFDGLIGYISDYSITTGVSSFKNLPPERIVRVQLYDPELLTEVEGAYQKQQLELYQELNCGCE